MSWSPELFIGMTRHWPDDVRVVRSKTDEVVRYVPERGLCHNVSESGTVFECSRCGAQYIPVQIVGEGERQAWRFCPRCGAVIA